MWWVLSGYSRLPFSVARFCVERHDGAVARTLESLEILATGKHFEDGRDAPQ